MGVPEKDMTPQEYLAHYGVKGMKWGVRRDDRGSGRSSSRGSSRSESKNSDLGKVMDDFYSKKSKSELQAEGKKKLKEQSEQEFPKVGRIKQRRTRKAEGLDDQVAKIDKTIEGLKAQKENFRPTQHFRRAQMQDRINNLTQSRDNLSKTSEQLKAGKLTTNEKMLIGIGAAVVVGGLAIYGGHQYKLHKSGLTSKIQAELFEKNKAETASQWKSLFGYDHEFSKAKSHLTAADGSFYAGLTSKKALLRPEFTIPKGTIFQRLSDHQEDVKSYTSGAYATFLSNDKKLYGASSEFGGKAYTVGFQAKGETRVPSLNTVFAHLKQIARESNPDVDDDDVFSQYHQMSGGSWSGETATKLFASLRQMGYSAIVDDMDAGYLGDLPIVFFGDAESPTYSPRTALDQLTDSVGVVKTSKKYA